MERTQKSTLWLWTTLWLTSFIDALLLYIVVFFASFVLHIPLTGIIALVLLGICYAAGAYLAARYVVKRSIITKTSAGKLAFLAILIPLIGSSCLVLFGLYSNFSKGINLSFVGLGTTVLLDVIILGIVYFIISSYIRAKGD